MWELDYKESWAPKNWCFWTVVLEKTLESPLDSKEIKLVNPKGNQSWLSIGRTDAEVDAPILWPPDERSWLIIEKTLMMGKTEGRRGWQDEMVGCYHRLHGHEFEQALRDGEGQGSLACAKSRTQLSDWTKNAIFRTHLNFLKIHCLHKVQI